MTAAPEIKIIFRDEHLVAVHKPPGLLVHRNAHAGREPFLLQLLRDQLGLHLFPVHRLDRPTSGLLVMALSPEAASFMARQFAAHSVLKSYIAVVRGFVAERGLIDSPLKSESGVERPAATAFSRLGTAELPIPSGPHTTSRFSLVRAEPLTGRTHQIRRHFAHIRHPLIGDVLRGDGRQNRLFRERFGVHRLLLASVELSLLHPEDGRKLRIFCAPDQELQELYGKMGWEIRFEGEAARPT